MLSIWIPGMPPASSTLQIFTGGKPSKQEETVRTGDWGKTGEGKLERETIYGKCVWKEEKVRE